MAFQEKQHPDDDPGDINVTWQDDSRLVTCSQDGRDMLGFGGTADEAVDNFMTLVLEAENGPV